MTTGNYRLGTHRRATRHRIAGVSRSDWLAALLMLAGVLAYARQYLNPLHPGTPLGLDLGYDLAYLGTLRQEFLAHGRLLTWYSVAQDGMPLLGHPLTHVFYLPLILPSLILGAVGGVRVAYSCSLVAAALGMYLLVRQLGARPLVAAWAGLLFPLSGTFAARILAGHVEKVLALPLVPWVWLAILLVGRARGRGPAARWGLVAGLLQGFTFLAGESYLPLYLAVAVPIALAIVALGQGRSGRWGRLLFGLGGWLAGLIGATAGKLLAAVDVVPGALPRVDALAGSEPWYAAIVHLADGSLLRNKELLRGAPEASAYAAWEYGNYVGVIPVLLAALAAVALATWIAARRGRSRAGFRRSEVTMLLAICTIGILWLADAYWYSPIHWLYRAVAPLKWFGVPSRALMLVTPAAIALAAVGLEVLLHVGGSYRLALQVLCLVLALAAAADLFLATRWAPVVAEPASVPGVRRIAKALRKEDPGRLLVDIGGFSAQENSAIILELGERGLRIDRPLSALIPRGQEQHSLIGLAAHTRYFIAPAGQAPTIPGSWQHLMEEEGVVAFRNLDAEGDAWLYVNGRVQPLSLDQAGPGRFAVHTTGPLGAVLVFQANAYPDWRVSIDGGPARPTSELAGFVAVATDGLEHSYDVYYESPTLPLVLGLGALPWAVSLGLVTRWALDRRRRHAATWPRPYRA